MEPRQLKPLQEGGAQFIVRPKGLSPQGRRCLWVDMGLGKTPTASRAGSLLQAKRWLILCKDSGINVWKFDGKAWIEQFTGLPVHIHVMDDSPWNREIEWNAPTSKDEIHIYVCVYNTFARDMGVQTKLKTIKHSRRPLPPKKIIGRKVSFDICIADEARRINNRQTAAYLGLRAFFRDHHCPHFIPMTGTPGDKGPPDWWAYFNLIDSKKFGSYWDFVGHFMVLEHTPYGLEILEQRMDTKEEWDRLVNEYCWIIREGEMKPPVQRQLITFSLDADQQKLYDDVTEEMMSFVNDEIVFAQNSMVQFLRLRQILICPKILGESLEVGGAIKRVVEEIQDNELKHSVIFTPFTQAFEPFTQYIQEKKCGPVYHLRGGITSDQQHTRLQEYRAKGGIILCSVKYAEAFSLEPATRSFFIGSDESPDVNRQAEKRLSRLTSADDILANYLTGDTPVDLRYQEIHSIKQAHIDFAQPKNLRMLLTGG